MKKLLTLTLLGLFISVASYAQPLISGTLGCCVGSGSTLIDSSVFSGGTWASSNTGVASVGITSGYVTGIAPGTATITFTSGGSSATAVYTVAAAPASITGPTSVCIGASITLSDATVGGTWESFGGAGVSSSGVVTGASSGTCTIEYITGPGCYAFVNVTVGSGPSPGIITGDSSVCAGSTTAMADATTGGVWTSSNTAIATVNASTGLVGGASAGVASISYTVTGPCGSVSAHFDVTVNAPGSAGTLTGSSSIVAGGVTTYSSTVAGGTWSSSNTGVATVNPVTGAVFGVGPGTTTITYTVTSCGPVATATAVVTVAALNRISGYINFSGGAVDSTSTIRVWLITFDPVTNLLEAVDSTTTFSGGSSAYYQFMGEPTDSYRVKAAVYPVAFSSTGYTPTYHTSSSYWGSANVFHHTITSTDDGENINMAYGTVTAGPGFIAGDVTTGANRGTSTGVPAVGMLIYALNSSGNIIQQAYTDAAGHYTFSNLPLGTYTVYPEAINYATTAYTSITLTGGAATMNAASFVQHLLSKTITPVTEGVNNVRSFVSSIFTFPNPTSGKLNVQWQESANETGNVCVADITGKELYKAAINMNEGTGATQLDLSGLTNGLYILTIKSGTINYNNKIQLQH